MTSLMDQMLKIVLNVEECVAGTMCLTNLIVFGGPRAKSAAEHIVAAVVIVIRGNATITLGSVVVALAVNAKYVFPVRPFGGNNPIFRPKGEISGQQTRTSICKNTDTILSFPTFQYQIGYQIMNGVIGIPVFCSIHNMECNIFRDKKAFASNNFYYLTELHLKQTYLYASNNLK